MTLPGTSNSEIEIINYEPQIFDRLIVFNLFYRSEFNGFFYYPHTHIFVCSAIR